MFLGLDIVSVCQASGVPASMPLFGAVVALGESTGRQQVSGATGERPVWWHGLGSVSAMLGCVAVVLGGLWKEKSRGGVFRKTVVGFMNTTTITRCILYLSRVVCRERIHSALFTPTPFHHAS